MTENNLESAIQSVSVPSPIEVPPPPDLSSLPTNILHTGTVETLLGLNEDLMARLKVNIRRNSLLEQQILENERSLANLNNVNSSLHSQIQVFQEKDRIVREKLEREENLYGAAKMRINSYKEQVAKLEAANRFQRRVRAWVRPMVNKLRFQLDEERKARVTREAHLSDLRARLSEAIQHVQNVEKQAAKDQMRLVEQYETRQKSLETELQGVKGLKDKAARFEEAVAKRTELENKVVFLERRATEIEKSLGAEIRELQSQSARYRQEAKNLAADASGKDQDLESAKAMINDLQEERNRIQDQFESLQAVWADAQKRLEASRIQLDSLNRLNQELSRQLKTQRQQTPQQATETNPIKPSIENQDFL